jgi:hypothetical protein
MEGGYLSMIVTAQASCRESLASGRAWPQHAPNLLDDPMK